MDSETAAISPSRYVQQLQRHNRVRIAGQHHGTPDENIDVVSVVRELHLRRVDIVDRHVSSRRHQIPDGVQAEISSGFPSGLFCLGPVHFLRRTVLLLLALQLPPCLQRPANLLSVLSWDPEFRIVLHWVHRVSNVC